MSRNFRILSGTFWLSVAASSYLLPLLDGHAHRYAWESFAIHNSGLASWALRVLVLGSDPAFFPIQQVCAVLFVMLLLYLSARGIGVKTWLFLVAWYAAGHLLYCALSTL